MTSVAITVAYAVRFGAAARINSPYFDDMLIMTVLTVVAAAVTYRACGLYRGAWRFASVQDLVNIVRAAAIVAAVLIAVSFLGRDVVIVPRTVVLVFWFVLVGLLGGPRLLYRLYRERRRMRQVKRSLASVPTLIVGAGAETELLIRSLESQARPNMWIVGLLAQSEADRNQMIRGVSVLGTSDELESVIESLDRRGMKPRRLLFTRDALMREANPEYLISLARRLDLLPSQVADPSARPASDVGPRLSSIRVDDFLARPVANFDPTAVRALLAGRRVLVTGGGGSIGSTLCRQIVDMGAHCLVIVENSELALYQVMRKLEERKLGVEVIGRICDVRDREAVDQIFAETRPELVFHAAALKHVPIVEENRKAGFTTNVLGTRNVADAAAKYGTLAMVFISTDKAIRPASFMGATKRLAELYCQALDADGAASRVGEASPPPRFLSVRFGNVIASTGSVLWLFQEQIERGGPVTVTHPDMERYFMTLPEATSLVLLASAHGLQRKTRDISVYVLDMGEPVKILDVAKRMIRLAGFEPDKDIPIEFIGMRPGERIHEELFHIEEAVGRIEIGGCFCLASAFRRVAGDLDGAPAYGGSHASRRQGDLPAPAAGADPGI